MGQTLTHGIYLPDEGERNCYSGLAANWQILDTSVGTIAEHTTALAGKAPLVHTHTKSDITDFPAYGNAAGTICEGNDSRLSDARTPVAHTHTKSDVTDLLNSNFIPSANNSYDLGSSSYQWNNLYAKKVNTQSVNGINPGALSLPSEDASSTNLDPTNWNTTGTQYNAYTPPSNGWLGIQVMSADTTDLTGQYLFAGRNTGGQDFWPQGQLVNLVGDFESNKLTGNIFFPVIANKQYQIRIKIGKTQTEGSIIRAKFYPCLGNV